MSRSEIDYLRHVLDEIVFLKENVAVVNETDFYENEILRRASVRSLEIIGEAAKNIPVVFKDRHPEIEWRSLTGLRDKLIHHYFGVDYEIVWDVVVNKLPELAVNLMEIVENESV